MAMNNSLTDIDPQVLEELEESMYIAFLNRNIPDVITILNDVRTLLGNPAEFNVQNVVRDLLFGTDPTRAFIAQVLVEYNKNSET